MGEESWGRSGRDADEGGGDGEGYVEEQIQPLNIN